MSQVIDSGSVRFPLISIVTVTYNSLEGLQRTVPSVVQQCYGNIEYIIIDGVSTDGSLEYLTSQQTNIILTSEPDKGIYDAMNKAVKIATGDFIYFLNSGDVLYDNMISRIAPVLIDPNSLYYGNVFRKDLQRLYDGKFSSIKLAVTNICHQAIFYPANQIKSRLFDLSYPIQADYALNMDMYGDKNIKFNYLPICIGEYEGNGISVYKMDYSFFLDKLKIIKRNFPLYVYLYAYLRSCVGRVMHRNKYIDPNA